MKIGIDARFYGGGKGLGRYIEKLIEYLEKLDNSNEYVIFLQKENWNDYTPQNSNFHKVLADVSWYSLSEQIYMPYLIYREKIDLMHFPHFNLPIFCPVKFIVTIHDLILLEYPTFRASRLNKIIYFIKNLAYRIVLRKAVFRSIKVLTISNYTKKRILDFFPGVSEGKIKVIYEASETKLGASDGANLDIDLEKKFGLVKPFFLYVGNAYPHKNLERLVEAFSIFSKNNGGKFQLALVGKRDFFYQRLEKEAQIQGWLSLKKQIVFLGYVDDQILQVLYKQALAYVFPSLVEGFGLPALEAMILGLPVMASNSSCLPEILGSGAIYFDPKNLESMIKCLSDLGYNLELRNKMRVLGYEQVAKYSWQKCASETLSQYNLFR